MSDTPTKQEIADALAVIERATDKGKRYTRAQLDGMTAERVAEVLAESPHAFDAIEEAEA